MARWLQKVSNIVENKKNENNSKCYKNLSTVFLHGFRKFRWHKEAACIRKKIAMQGKNEKTIDKSRGRVPRKNSVLVLDMT
jgi:hypothetical protein